MKNQTNATHHDAVAVRVENLEQASDDVRDGGGRDGVRLLATQEIAEHSSESRAADEPRGELRPARGKPKG